MDDPKVLKILSDAAAGVDALARDEREYLTETRLIFEEVLTTRCQSPFTFVMMPYDRLARMATVLKNQGY